MAFIDEPATNRTRKIWKNTPRPIFLDPVARNREMGVGDPSYTSGAHMWKGTAAILKPYPATMHTSPTASIQFIPSMVV